MKMAGKTAINKTLASLKAWQELCILVYYILVYYKSYVYMFFEGLIKNLPELFFFFAPKLSRICTICVVRGKFTLSERTKVEQTCNYDTTINFHIIVTCLCHSYMSVS